MVAFQEAVSVHRPLSVAEACHKGYLHRRCSVSQRPAGSIHTW